MSRDPRTRHELVRQVQPPVGVWSGQAGSSNKCLGDLQMVHPRAPISSARLQPIKLPCDANLSVTNGIHKLGHSVPSGSTPRGPRPRHYHKCTPINPKVMARQYYPSDVSPEVRMTPNRNVPVQPHEPKHSRNTLRPPNGTGSKGPPSICELLTTTEYDFLPLAGVHSTTLIEPRQKPMESLSGAGVLQPGSTVARLYPSGRAQAKFTRLPKQRPTQHPLISRMSGKDKRKQLIPPHPAVVNQADDLSLREGSKIPQSSVIQLPRDTVKAYTAQPVSSLTAFSRDHAIRKPPSLLATKPSQATPHELGQAQPRRLRLNAESRRSQPLSSRSIGLHRSASVHRRPTPLRPRPLAQAQIQSSRVLRPRVPSAHRELRLGPAPAPSVYPLRRPVGELAATKHTVHMEHDGNPDPSTYALSKFAKPAELHTASSASISSVSPPRHRFRHSTKRSARVLPKRHGSKNASRLEYSLGRKRNAPMEVVDAPARHERTSISTAESSTPPRTPEDSKTELPAIVDVWDAEGWRGNVELDPEWQSDFNTVVCPQTRAKAVTVEEETTSPVTGDKAQMTWNHLAALGLNLSPFADSRHSQLGTPSDSGFNSETFIPEATAVDAPVQTRSLEDDHFGPRDRLLARLADRKKIKTTWASDHEETSVELVNDMVDLHPDIRCTLTALRSPI